MRAIQHYLPNPRHVETNRIFVKAKPAEAWEAARHFDAAAIPWVRTLFNIRTLPDRLKGRQPKEEKISVGVDQVTADGKGFRLLQEIPGREVVIGSVGQFWHLNIPFANVEPDDFRDFEKPGWGKLAWAISVEPYRDGSTISLELRTAATDQHSWEKLNNYYRVIGIGSKLIREAAMSHLEAELGKMKLPDDDTRILPGDDIIPDARYIQTYAVNIEAPVSVVWRYLMQLGCDRAGWYSIDLLDHGGQPSTDYLVPGWEMRQLGEHLDATPARDSFFTVQEIEHERFMVIGGQTERAGGPFNMSWAFVVEPIGTDACRLISRARMKASPQWAEWLMGKVVYPPVHGLMSGVQLKTMRRLSERDAVCRVEHELAMA